MQLNMYFIDSGMFFLINKPLDLSRRVSRSVRNVDLKTN